MRKKPSIFSKDYEKQMKRRKIKIFSIFAVCLILIVLLCIYLTGTFKTVLRDMGKKNQNNTVQNQSTKNKASVAPAKNIPDKSEHKKTQYTVKLSNGKSVNLIYEKKNNSKVFKDVTPKDADLAYSISPSGKNAVVFDSKSQSILLFDINGNKQDITNQQYVSSSGTVISKSSQLASTPGYVWCSSPKFIDDNNIAYISQLPWLGRTSKYVWIENIPNKSHVMVQSIEGDDIKFGDVSNSKLAVTVDSSTVYISNTGDISQ